jgi:hypothetical protein
MRRGVPSIIMTLSPVRKKVLLALLFVTPLGFIFKFYSGPAAWWFSDFGAGSLYEVFWILVVFFFFTREELADRIAIWVFLVTCLLEFLQLWHPPALERFAHISWEVRFWGRPSPGGTFRTMLWGVGQDGRW